MTIEVLTNDSKTVLFCYRPSSEKLLSYRYLIQTNRFFVMVRGKWCEVDEEDEGVMMYFDWRTSITG